MAESNTAVIDALTDWVVGAAVEAYQVLAELGVSVPLAVNMSTQNLHDLTVPDRLEQRLRAGGMPARHLCLEITESAAFKDASLTMDILSRVRLKGMQLSIDDFGTGYSSLKVLRQMPFSEIKIDRSFVSRRDDVAGFAGDREVDHGPRRQHGDGLRRRGGRDRGDRRAAGAVGVVRHARVSDRRADAGGGGSRLAGDLDAERHGGAASRARDAAPELAMAAGAGGGRRCGAGAARRATAADAAVRLSPRQLEVMQLLSEGCSVKEIARRLDIGIGTVKVHLSLAYSALGARATASRRWRGRRDCSRRGRRRRVRTLPTEWNGRCVAFHRHCARSRSNPLAQRARRGQEIPSLRTQ